MHSKKTQKHLGQQQLDGVTEYDEQRETEGQRLPIGMPILSTVRAYANQLGLTDDDAEHIYDSWLMSGFRTSRGAKIVSWRAAMRLWHRSGFFASQKEAKDTDVMSRKMLDVLASSNAYRKIDVEKAAWDFKKWCKENNRTPLKTSFIKFLDSKL
jgi:hypothetical protein